MSQKISQLPAVIAANIQDTDVLPLVATNITSKVTVANLRTKLGTQPPTGGRTVTDAFTYLDNNKVFNVKDFGARGDGATNDTAAIQLTIDKASLVRGGMVYLPEGNYIISDTLWISVSGLKFVGAGGHFDPTYPKSTQIDASTIASGKDAIVVIGPSANSMRSVSFKDFYLVMNAPSGQVGGAGIKVWNASYFEFDAHVEVNRGVTSYALQLSDLDTAAAGGGTVTSTAGAAVFSTSQRGKLINGDTITVAGTPRTVSAFNYTTGLTCTLSGAPTFGASAFTITPSIARAVITSPKIRGGVAGNGMPLLVGLGCTSVVTSVYSLNAGAEYSVLFYGTQYSGAGPGSAADSNGNYAYGIINSRNVNLDNVGAEFNGKSAVYIKDSVGTAVKVEGVANNSLASAVIPSLIHIAAGISHVTTIRESTDVAPNAATTLSVKIEAGNFDTILQGSNSTTMPKGIGGDATAVRNVTTMRGGSIISAVSAVESAVIVGAASGVAQSLFVPVRGGLYLVSANLVGGGNVQAMCVVTFNGTGTVLLMPGMTQTTDARLNFTLVGSAVKVTQTLGAPTDITWSYSLLPM